MRLSGLLEAQEPQTLDRSRTNGGDAVDLRCYLCGPPAALHNGARSVLLPGDVYEMRYDVPRGRRRELRGEIGFLSMEAVESGVEEYITCTSSRMLCGI